MDEEDIKILEEFKTNGYSMLLMKYGDRTKTNLKIERALENILKAYKELEQENKELKEDIKNMYSEEVIISIISDEFNLTRSEVLNLLGESEE